MKNKLKKINDFIIDNFLCLSIGFILGMTIILAKIDRNNNNQINNNNEIETEMETTIEEEITTQKITIHKKPFIQKFDKETINFDDMVIISELETESVKYCIFEPYDFITLSKENQEIIYEICEENELSFDLMLSIAMQESKFVVNAYNEYSDDYGLFQINAPTWNDKAIELGFGDYKTNVADNTRMACWIVNYCLDISKGDLKIALNYYRTGTPYPKYEINSDYATIVINNMLWFEEMKGM